MTAELPKEIEAAIDFHTSWYRRDFATAQLILWLGILASVVSAILASGAFQIEQKWIPAVIASIPGAALLVDKTFKFGVRSSWHAIYAAGLRGLRRELRDAEMPAAAISQKLTKLDENMEKLFPPLDSGMLQASK